MARTYRVVSQKLETVPDFENGGFSQQWNIGYLIHEGPAAGVRGEIHVPANRLNPEVVSEALDRLVDQHHAVASI